MVHSPLPTEVYSSYPTVYNPRSISLANNYHLDNMSSKSPFNGTDNNISKKRKQEYQYPITPETDYYLTNQPQKTQLLYQPQHSQQLVNVAYPSHQQHHHHQQQQQRQQQITTSMLNPADWQDYVRSNPSTPTNSSPQNAITTLNTSNGTYNNGMNGSTMNLDDYLINSFTGLEALYPYNSTLGTSIPMTSTEFPASTTNFGYDDVNNTTPCSNNVMSDRHHQVDNGSVSMCDDANESESRKDTVYDNNHQTLDQLATAAALIAASRDDKSSEQISYDSSMNENIRQNRNRPHLMPLNITSAATQSNIYRINEIPTDFGFVDSIASSPSPAVTMPPTPVFFEPGFLDGVTNTISEGFTFGINPEQLLENNQISVSRSHSYDSVSSSSQQSAIFTSKKIVETPQTVTPTAITINQPFTTQPNFAPVLSQTPSSLDTETDYFNGKHHQKCDKVNNNNNNNSSSSNNSNNTVRRTRSRTLSNPPNIKVEPRTPALSPPESPASISSSSSSPPSPSPPQTPNYMRRLSISPTIMEEEEEILVSSSNTTNPVSLVSSSYVPDMSNINSTVNPRLTQSAAANMMRPVIQQYINSSNPAALGEKTVMVLTSKVAQKSYGTEKR